MKYYISRGGQQYGPYSMEDLRSMRAQARIDANDLAWGENMASWIPVSQMLGSAPAAAAPPQPAPQPQRYAPLQEYTPPQQYAPPGGAYGAGTVPAPYGSPGYAMQTQAAGLMPPNLHWGLVLLFSFLTFGIFGLVWLFIETSFVNKIDPRSNATVLYICGILIPLAGIILIIVAHFNMRASIERYYNTVEPIGLRLSGVMTFFVAVLYFQYHFSRIATWKQTGRLM